MSFEINDRVKEIESTKCAGTVIEIRNETVTNKALKNEPPKLIKVHWDNGTKSYYSPEKLEKAA